MDGIGALLQSLARGIGGMVEGAVHAFGAAVQGVVAALHSVLPGPWLPIVAFVVLVIAGFSLAKR